jgi:ubiquinone/menaquinone biosynthesis C-methylase UbiE
VLNKNSVRLVLELIGECDLGGRSVLDVGCGRGGLISVIQTYFTPRSVAGLDLSSEAIRFCRRTHGRSGAVFLEGDAERLPFREGSFDVVSNLESSHSYPMIGAFYSEVRRVLKPGGHFLYSDLFPRNEMERHVNELRRLGFSVLKDHDITRNVVLSCDEIAEMRTQSFAQTNDPLLLDEFLATPASAVYQDMARGITTYRIFDLRLTEST